MSEAASPSLAYHEPGIFTIMIQSSLLILLNVINFVLDKFLYCGLIGQILLGVAWGTPGLRWLESSVETAIVQLGYLGLLLLVYEVAVTGISIPIGLSFVLMRLTNATPLQCFAAGSSLSSTSLGTTFTVLGTSGLTRSRLGVVLTTAAMMDDVVGLVLVQVISNLGKEGASITASIVIRPLLVSVGFIVLTPLLCLFLVRPLMRRISQVRKRLGPGACSRFLASEHLALLVHTLILLGYVIGASFSGTSNLFAAYIAGASVSWWDSTGSDKSESSAATSSADRNLVRPSIGEGNKGNQTPNAKTTGSQTIEEDSATSGLHVYESYFSTPVDRILKPFFFASIGFSIPITKMFSGDIVWKGFVYAMLMILAKLACGIWLVRISMSLPASWKTATKSARQILRLIFMPRLGFGRKKSSITEKKRRAASAKKSVTNPTPQTSVDLTCAADNPPRTGSPVTTQAEDAGENNNGNGAATSNGQGGRDAITQATPKPRSLYPASIIGCAMVARGEIGFLISSIAESNNIFSASSGRSSTSDLFLIVTWAIVLCTILGPLAVGLLVRRVRRLQNNAKRKGQTVPRDVLGVWGIS
ncbi:hypothetical protein E4U56_004819 [Claviceps arundinis]|uniref:Cation/H+ exchanger transmembrane domain-containing protein n=1 Tax=Claviceps arundinis TaxID=1623583 RepID=A0A9P7MZ86_9HYPO|nr:hypothetical protein E4U56_004819 [Claviceps arundinis]